MEVSRALISVAKKNGLKDFVIGLRDLGIEIVTTGGTANFLESKNIEVKRTSKEMDTSDILGGRVKTLYPQVHAGILASKDSADHMKELKRLGVEPIDLVVVNLYPFKEVSKTGEIDEAVENIDIGGVALIRSAAKNYAYVGVVTDPGDYGEVLEELRENDRRLKDSTRKRLSVKAFSSTSDYDRVISDYFDEKFQK